ncbi:hypothetical protein [Pseudomonas sp. PI1]|nr:hypothetical protein [Pseudomonas sp. PI1]
MTELVIPPDIPPIFWAYKGTTGNAGQQKTGSKAGFLGLSGGFGAT